MGKHARTVKPTPEGFVYACVANDDTRAAAVEERHRDFRVHGTDAETGETSIVHVVRFRTRRDDRFRDAIKWSCRWAGRKEDV